MTKFITFYSFTGNENTTAAILQTTRILQEKGVRTLLLDMNIQAPTLSFHLSVKQPGIMELFSDAKELGMKADLFALPAEEVMLKYALPQQFKMFDPEAVYRFLSVGNLSENYVTKFDALKLRELYQEGLGEPLIRVLKKIITDSNMFDCVLINSGSGYSDEMGMCVRDLADHVLFFTGPIHFEATHATVQLFRENKISFKMVFQNFDTAGSIEYWVKNSALFCLPDEATPKLSIYDYPQVEFDKVFVGTLSEASQLYADYYFLSEYIERLTKVE